MSFGIFLAALSLILGCASTVPLADLHWNSSNPLFRDPSHSGAEIYAQKMDSLVIHCPSFNDSTPPGRTEQLIIHRVSKFGYDNCVLDEAKVVGRCAKPYVPQSIRTVFREFTPLPTGLEYSPGKTYFFISTSDGTAKGMDLVAGGLCLSKGLKLKIHIHNHRHQHNHRRNYHSTTQKGALGPEPTAEPRFWNEFLNKLPSSSVGSRPSRIRESVALDPKGISNQENLAYERQEGSISEALRLQPTSMLYEIHEFDEYGALVAPSRSARRSDAILLFCVFVFVRRVIL